MRRNTRGTLRDPIKLATGSPMCFQCGMSPNPISFGTISAAAQAPATRVSAFVRGGMGLGFQREVLARASGPSTP